MPVLRLHAHTFVRRDPADVAAYVRSVPHAVWRTDLTATDQHPDQPLRLGTLLRQDVVVAGLTVSTESSVTGLLPAGGFVFDHHSGAVPMSGELRVAPHDDGARIDYRVRMELHGAWALLAPVLRFSRPRVMAASLDELRFRLEASVLSPRRLVVAAH